MISLVNRCSTALRRPCLGNLQGNSVIRSTLSRSSSLSAIHRGLRHSERAQYGDSSERNYPLASHQHGSEGTRSQGSVGRSRLKAREDWSLSRAPSSRGRRDEFLDKFSARVGDGAPSWRQQQKLGKKLAKKKREDEEEAESGRKTRRKRFIDPETDFGKQSLVYRLKYGDLKEKAKQLPLQEFVKPVSFRSLKRHNTSNAENGEARPQDGNTRRRQQDEKNDDVRRETTPRGPKKPMMSMVVKYTTAASQFLYGRSVVKAALEQSRRKLYNLYIYGGQNRKDSKDNVTMARLASKHGVPVTIVPENEQRIMDKMSMGRPHNGFVLEASPLPRLPITSLGKLEETPGKLGFHVSLDFQSKEDEAINGTDTFIRRSNDLTPKPFVLLMNEIVDPGNLGGIIRTASYLGVDAVGITSRGSSTLTPVVLKSAAGAVEEITLFTVNDTVKFLEESRKSGWKTYAAVAPPDRKLVRRHGEKFTSTDDIEVKDPLSQDPCILVLGSEGYGLPKEVKLAADYELSVPRFIQNSCVDSLNVSVAAGLLCHSFVRQRQANNMTSETEQAIQDQTEAEEKPGEEAEKVF